MTECVLAVLIKDDNDRIISSVLNEEDRNRIRRDNVFTDDENDRMYHDGGKKKQTTTECALPMFNG